MLEIGKRLDQKNYQVLFITAPPAESHWPDNLSVNELTARGQLDKLSSCLNPCLYCFLKLL